MEGIVREICSTPRITKMTKTMPRWEVLAGFALNLTTCDTDGRAWKFDEEDMRTTARQKVDAEEPMSLI